VPSLSGCWECVSREVHTPLMPPSTLEICLLLLGDIAACVRALQVKSPRAGFKPDITYSFLDAVCDQPATATYR
jgi:hypothetical protein